MPTVTAFPPIDLSDVTARPLVETFKKGPETPVFNKILRDRRRGVSQLRNTKWPAVSTVEPEPFENEPPQPISLPDVTPEPDETPAPEPAPEPAPAPETPAQE